MSSISINPLTFSKRILFDRGGKPNVQEFNKLLGDLGQWANQMQNTLINPAVLSSLLNGNQQLSSTALKKVTFFAQYTVATNPTIDCTGASLVSVYIIMGNGGATSVTSGITLSKLDDNVPVHVTVWNNQTNANSYFVVSSDAGGTTRAQTLFTFATGVGGAGFSDIHAATTMSATLALTMIGMASSGILWMHT